MAIPKYRQNLCDAHWFLLISCLFFNPLEGLWKKSAIMFVHTALQDGTKLTYSFYVSCLRGEIVGIGDS